MPPSQKRRSHFLGAKLRALRKQNGLTLDELSARCVQVDPELAPSVSYLSMIENGKRVPSPAVLDMLAAQFQREATWFLDGTEDGAPSQHATAIPATPEIPLEPSFLFSKKLLQASLPELLSQTGTTGRQFAQLLIRSHQEMAKNDFPDLERAAEAIGGRKFPLQVEDLIGLCEQHGLTLRWFEHAPVRTRDTERELKSMVRSFYDPPGTIYVNSALQAMPARLKYDLAAHLAHKVLHDGDGMKSVHATGGPMGGAPRAPAR